MTYPISDITRRVVYSGSLGTGPYPFTFEILEEGDIGVYKNQTLLTLSADYTVTINADGTGEVDLVSAAASTDTVAIFGDKGIQRQTDFTTGGDLFANSLNDELDAQTIFAQQNAEAIVRAIRAPQFDPTNLDMTLPSASDRADTVLTFDTNGEPQATSSSSFVAGLAGSILGANYVTNTAVGDGSTVNFTVSVAPGAKGNIQIYIDGVYQNKSSFSISGTTVTFTEAPPLNASVEFIIGYSIGSVGNDAGDITYTPAGTGALTTDVETKLREFVSVKDFGATGDGVTDDTAAIQTALTSTGKNIVFPRGNYLITSPITFRADRRVIDFDNSKIIMSGASTRFNVASYAGVLAATLKNGKFEGDSAETCFYFYSPDSLTNLSALAVWGAKFILDTCEFRGFSKENVKANKAHSSLITNCDFYGTDSTSFSETGGWDAPSSDSVGILFAGGYGQAGYDDAYSFSNGNIVRQCRFTNYNIGFSGISTGRNDKIENCTFENCSIGIRCISSDATGYYGGGTTARITVYNAWFERLNEYISGDVLDDSTGAVSNPSWADTGIFYAFKNVALYNGNGLNYNYIVKKDLNRNVSHTYNLYTENGDLIATNANSSDGDIVDGVLRSRFTFYAASASSSYDTEQLCLIPIHPERLTNDSYVSIEFRNRGANLPDDGIDIYGIASETDQCIKLWYKEQLGGAASELTLANWYTSGASVSGGNPIYFQMNLEVRY
jgi:hypothetical protein